MQFVENYVKPYQALRSVAWGALLLFVLSNVGWAFAYFQLQQQGVDRVYVVGQDGTFPARLQDLDAPTVFEARNHVKGFLELMFAHDATTYDQRIELALHRIDKEDGLAIFKDFEEHQVRDNYIKHGSRSILEVDAVELNMQAEPYQGKVWARQEVIYGESQKVISISATFEIVRTRRSDANPFGLLIREWKFVPYSRQKGGAK